MKILVTGAAGFIGYHLCESLLQFENEIVGIDNLNDYYDQNLKIARLKELGFGFKDLNSINDTFYTSNKSEKLRFLRLDICETDGVKSLLENEGFDVIVNLAAQAGVRYSIENPTAYVNTNIVGFHNLIENANRYKVKHFIYASSSSVYGFNDKMPFSESDRVDHPVSMYAATKKSNELIAHVYSHLHGLKTTGVRFFTVYGPWGRPDMAPFLFTKAIVNNQTIKVFNNGDLFRDFTFIDDIVDGVMAIIQSDQSNEQKSDDNYNVYNIGNSTPIRLMDFISITEKHVGTIAKKDFLSMQPGDVYKTYADTEALKAKVNYSPKTNLDEGMEKFVRWYKYFYNKQ